MSKAELDKREKELDDKSKDLEKIEKTLQEDEELLQENKRYLKEDEARFDNLMKEKLGTIEKSAEEVLIKLNLIKWEKKSGKKIFSNDRLETIAAAKELGWKLLK